MGNSFASIHIRTNNVPKISSSILKTYDADKGLNDLNPMIRDEYLKIVENAKLLGNKLLNSVLRISNDATILETTNMVSVYDRNLSFETVMGKALDISRKVAEPVLYLSNFDNDVFILGVLEKGVLCTSGVFGEYSREYGLNECPADLDILGQTFGLSTEGLEQVFADTDDTFAMLENLQQELEGLLGVPLNFRKDWIDIYDGTYRKKHESNGVDIYEKC